MTDPNNMVFYAQIGLDKLNVPINVATVYYLGGVDPQNEWGFQDLSFHNVTDQKKHQELLEQRQKSVEFFKTEAGQKKIADYLKEVGDVTRALFHEGAVFLDKYLPDKEFYFVIGAMRSGGTYFYSELCQIFGIDFQKYSLGMTHDCIPSYPVLINWHQPHPYLSSLFELAQYLVWVKREQGDMDTIIQKRIAYAHSMPILDNLLGHRSRYIITIRHPFGISQSFAKMESIDTTAIPTTALPGWNLFVPKKQGLSDQNWKQLSYDEQVLHYWEVFYKDIVRESPYRGLLVPLVFGTQYSDYLNSLAKERGLSLEAQKNFNPKKRNPTEAQQKLDFSATLSRVQELWKCHGHQFPDVDFL